MIVPLASATTITLWPPIGLQLDELSTDARLPERLERLGRQVSGQFDEREVVAHLDATEIISAEVAFVRDRADDLTRVDLLPATDLDAVHREIGAAITAISACRAIAAIPSIIGLVEKLRSLCSVARELTVVVLREQQRGVPLRDHRESGSDIGLGNVVVSHVMVDDVAKAIDASRFGERRGDGVIEAGEPRLVDLFHIGKRHLREWLFRRLLNRLEKAPLTGGHEADRVSRTPRPAGAADAVHVRLRIDREVEIDDVTDAFDIEPAGRHIGRDEDVELAVLQRLHGLLTHILRHVAVDRGGRIAASAKLFRHLLRVSPRAREDDEPIERLHLENAGERIELLHVRDDHVALGGVRARLRLRGDANFLGVGEVLLGDTANLRGHRGREQCDLFVVRSVGENRLDVFGKAHLEHLIRLVEHEIFQLCEIERALLEVIHDAAGRAHDNVDAAAQRRQLLAVPLAAVDGKQAHLGQMGRVTLERFAHLQGEFAGGREHERLRHPSSRNHTGQNRKRERGGLARARLGETDDIAALEQHRNRGGLNGRGLLVAHIFQRSEDARFESEVVEGGRGDRGGSLSVGGVQLIR